jgi:hypothetical protein
MGFKRIRSSILAVTGVLALGLSVLSGVTPDALASHTTVLWKGQAWEVPHDGTAVVNGSGHLVLTRTAGTADVQLHINRILPTGVAGSFVNDNGTPWVQYSYLDNGQQRGVDIFIEEEVSANLQNPRLQAGSLFDCQGLGYARYNNPALEEIVFGQGVGCGPLDLAPSARAAGQAHTIYVGQRADGTIDYRYDGLWFTSTYLKDNVGHFNFNDVYLRLRASSGTTATFTDFQAGDNHSSPLADKDNCKKDGWKAFRNADGSLKFKNQGDCVSYTNTGR